MGRILELFFDWSEVWALLIPLFFVLSAGKVPAVLKPVAVYLWLALALNLLGDVIGDFKKIYPFPHWLQSNNPLYNIHSLVRFVCFGYFFTSVTGPQFKTFKKIVNWIFILFVLTDFTLFENFFNFYHLSGDLLSAESYLLLVYGLLYYLSVLNDENDAAFSGPVFWIVTGLCIYVVINFFIFLFYVPMITKDIKLALGIWNVHNVAYLILCLFIARAFYITTPKYATTENYTAAGN